MREISELEIIASRNKTTTQQDEGWPGRNVGIRVNTACESAGCVPGEGQHAQPKLYVLQKGYAVALMPAVQPTW